MTGRARNTWQRVAGSAVLVWVAAAGMAAQGSAPAASAGQAPAPEVTYAKHIAPILQGGAGQRTGRVGRAGACP